MGLGTRMAEKILKTLHSWFGNTHPEMPLMQITYPNSQWISPENPNRKKRPGKKGKPVI